MNSVSVTRTSTLPATPSEKRSPPTALSVVCSPTSRLSSRSSCAAAWLAAVRSSKKGIAPANSVVLLDTGRHPRCFGLGLPALDLRAAGGLDDVGRGRLGRVLDEGDVLGVAQHEGHLPLLLREREDARLLERHAERHLVDRPLGRGGPLARPDG